MTALEFYNIEMKKFIIMYLGQGTADTFFTHYYFDSKEKALRWLKSPQGYLNHSFSPDYAKKMHISVLKSADYHKDYPVYNFKVIDTNKRIVKNTEIVINELYEFKHI